MLLNLKAPQSNELTSFALLRTSSSVLLALILSSITCVFWCLSLLQILAAYRLEVNWLVAGSSSVQDLVQTLYKKAYKLGLRLAQVNFD